MGSHGYHGNYRYRDRINEDDVPESKHTIFIRGLPGDMSTDTIKDYFEDKIGPVSFDFVKTSTDNTRLFVAVRFESRDDAKTAMTKFNERDILGHDCQLSWFKDVRRFAEYQKAQGLLPSRGRGGYRGRGGFRGSYRNDYRDRRNRDGSRDRSRSRSRSSRRSSRSRSKSRSASERSRSARRSRSRSARSSSHERRRSTSRESAASKDSDYKRRDKKKRRSRRSTSKRSNVSSERDVSDDERKNGSRSASPAPPVNNPPPPQIKVSIKTTKEDLPEIPIPPTNYNDQQSAPPAPVPAPPGIDQLKTSFSIGIDTDEPKIVQKIENRETVILGGQDRHAMAPPGPPVAEYHGQPAKVPYRGNNQGEEPHAKMPRLDGIPPVPNAASYQNPYNAWTPVKKETQHILNESPAAQKENGFGYTAATRNIYDKFPIQNDLFSEIPKIQEKALSDVKAVSPDDTFGVLSLSALAADTEIEKRFKREQKLGSMSTVELERFMIQKKKFENLFRNDCVTYATVTKRLLSKDSTIEKELRMCLIENMDDLEKQMMEKIDEYLGI